MTHVLILVTNHATLGDTDEKNGTYIPELTHALHEFNAAGWTYDLASINGGAAPIYGEDAEDDPITQEMLADRDFRSRLANTLTLNEVKSRDYDAVFYPGGFGLLSDLASNKEAAAVTAHLYEQGAVVGAVCHGPAGLLPITLSDGQPLLAGKTVTGFTREEEVDFGTIDKIPCLLEESLTRKAGAYTKKGPWTENIVQQDRLITGQNPASAAGVGRAMVERIKSLFRS